MPIIKSAIKRARQQVKRREHNVEIKKAIKLDVKALAAAVESKNSAKVTETLRATISEIDRAAKKGLIHKNTASRRKSRLTLLANQVAKPTRSAKSKPTKPAAKAVAKTTPKTTPQKTTAKPKATAKAKPKASGQAK